MEVCNHHETMKYYAIMFDLFSQGFRRRIWFE